MTTFWNLLSDVYVWAIVLVLGGYVATTIGEALPWKPRDWREACWRCGLGAMILGIGLFLVLLLASGVVCMVLLMIKFMQLFADAL